MTEVVLASTSRYRAQLLQRLKVNFSQHAPECDETPKPGESPLNLVTRLAASKALSVADRFPEAVIIGSDQVAVSTEVQFKSLADELIERYLVADKPYDCAASFRSESCGSWIVERMCEIGHGFRISNSLNTKKPITTAPKDNGTKNTATRNPTISSHTILP